MIARTIKTEGVCGGSACVGDTRIPVWLLESLRRRGLDGVEILLAYPTLTAAMLEKAWVHVSRHREEIDREIAENQEGAS